MQHTARRRRAGAEPTGDRAARMEEGRTRLRACKMCSTSFYLALSSIIAFFVLFSLGGAIAGLVAVVLGLWGRAWLLKLGPTTALRDSDAVPIERVAARMQPRAEREGLLGPLIGGGIAAYWFLLYFSAAGAR